MRIPSIARLGMPLIPIKELDEFCRMNALRVEIKHLAGYTYISNIWRD